jgi:hypothetical protein
MNICFLRAPCVHSERKINSSRWTLRTQSTMNTFIFVFSVYLCDFSVELCVTVLIHVSNEYTISKFHRESQSTIIIRANSCPPRRIRVRWFLSMNAQSDVTTKPTKDTKKPALIKKSRIHHPASILICYILKIPAAGLSIVYC